MFEYIINLIAPTDCLSCGQEGLLLCSTCQSRISYAGSSLQQLNGIDGLYAATGYERQTQALVHALKFERLKSAAKVVACIMDDRLPQLNVDYVIHVPTATSRVRARGYDQAMLVARHFAALRCLPYAPLLHRQGQLRQVGQKRAVRQSQLSSAFWTSGANQIKGKRILLIDDVVTTGSTIQAAASVLKQAGAESITAAVFAAA